MQLFTGHKYLLSGFFSWLTGRGLDTLQLAQIVGAEGTVIGLDVQVSRRLS